MGNNSKTFLSKVFVLVGNEWITITLRISLHYKYLLENSDCFIVECYFDNFSYILGLECQEHDILKLDSDVIFGISVWNYGSGESTGQGSVSATQSQEGQCISPPLSHPHTHDYLNYCQNISCHNGQDVVISTLSSTVIGSSKPNMRKALCILTQQRAAGAVYNAIVSHLQEWSPILPCLPASPVLTVRDRGFSWADGIRLGGLETSWEMQQEAWQYCMCFWVAICIISLHLLRVFCL